MRRRVVCVAAIAVFIVALPGTAIAAWSDGGNGPGYARAQTVPAGPASSVSVDGRNVTLTWSAVSFPGGAAVAGYRVSRFPAAGGASQTILSACDGTIAGLTCTERAVPSGSWTYEVAAVQAGWTGLQGPASAAATVGSPTFTFSSSAPVTTLPATLGGSLSNFITDQTVTFRLDSPTGTLLAGSVTPSPIPVSGAAATSVTIPAGTADGVHTVYALGSAGDVATATVTTDGTAPVVSAAVIGKSQSSVVGAIKQGGTYYVYASIADVGSGVTSARADVSAITTGSTAVTLTAGAYTAGGVAYNYRSALLTASNPLSAGSKAFSITATDGAAHTGTATGFTVAVDNTAPSGADVQTTNRAGGVAGRAETGDSVTYTFSEPIDPISLVAGWDGTGVQTVTVRLLQNGTGDKLQVWDATNMARLALGTIQLANTDYVGPGFNFTSSTMTMSGSTITIVFGTPSGTSSTVTAPGTMVWTPASGATDWAANACSTTNVSESGGADVEF